MSDSYERDAVLVSAIGELKSSVGELKGICAGTACQLQHQSADLKEVLARLGKLENRTTALEERMKHWRTLTLATSAASGVSTGGLGAFLAKLFGP